MTTPPQNYTLTPDIPYTTTTNPHPSTHHHLDLYTPHPTPTSQPPHPLIIYIHGGAFKTGDKRNPLLPLRLVTERHYALASLNYRLSGTATFPAAIHDVRAATRFLRANAAVYSLDSTRFVAVGESAGAYMALMIGVPGPRHLEFDVGENLDVDAGVLGVIDLYGPVDFGTMDQQAPAHATLRHGVEGSPESLFLGATVTEVPELVRRASPLAYIGGWTPPVLIVHGVEDCVVPFGQGVLLEEALRESGREVVLHRVEGVDHCFEGISEVQQGVLDGVVDGWLRERFGR